VARNTDPECEDHDRYRKIGKSEIFNAESLHGSDRPVFVTEGEIDALSVMSAGGEAAALGSVSNADKLLRLVKENPPAAPLIVALDNDEKGNKVADKLVQGLSRIGVKALPINPYGESKDANAALVAGRESFKAAIREAERKMQEPPEPATAKPRPRAQRLQDSMAISMKLAFESEPPMLDFILPGFLAGTVGALIAPGSTGKSFWALEACMAVACGGMEGGDLLDIRPSAAGRVHYFAGEDPEPAIMLRIHEAGKHLSETAKREIDRNMTMWPMMGCLANIMEDGQRDWVIRKCAGSRLIVFDTLSRIHLLDENSNGDMAMLVGMLEHIAKGTGASVLYLHHANKGSIRDGQPDQQHAARGASALVDNARWCGYMAKMTENEAKMHTGDGLPIGGDRRLYVRFGVSKQNHGEAIEEQWYKRNEGGILTPVKLTRSNAGKGDENNGYRIERVGS
jgi:5S rRNA maturation endonuclease (ribonuclease M5)